MRIIISLFVLIIYSISFPTVLHLSNQDLMFYEILRQKYKWLDTSLYCIVVERSIVTGLDPIFICSLIHFESGGKRTAISNKKARGFMQLMPCHLKGTNYTIWDLYKPYVNILLGCKHFAFCKKLARGDLAEALRLYNQGHYGNRDDYKNWKYVWNILLDYYFLKFNNKIDLNFILPSIYFARL